MKDSLSTDIFQRELADTAARSKHYRKLYSNRRLIDDLDIVNELDGHSGCVNALSWSKSGQLLASGSDDQHLNIHQYQPTDSDNQFHLMTTVATGHSQNIFSVKFMPHSNDRTVITAAGDAEVRVFDLEYSGQATVASRASIMASEGRRRGRNTVYNGVRYLTDGDTNNRVYRSHGDRVKRIVTESSPHLFLTCSEDGEVRQWDLRQPSSAYPAPRGGRVGGNASVPPPLISYKRYQLDLNTISCSANQPHYIALGGAHLHAFLHDRRMIGRDRLREAGTRLSTARSMSLDEEELMGQATKCVRKFAPDGKKQMRRTDSGHITACKISDARPNEMIASWSGDHIYSFDLIRSPDAGDNVPAKSSIRADAGTRVRESKERKRKRKPDGSEVSLGQDGSIRASSKPRTSEEADNEVGTALRIRYQNGQSEDIPVSADRAVPATLSADQRAAQRIAKATVKIRSSIFGAADVGHSPTSRFSDALGKAASILDDVTEVMSEWRYPMDPSPHIVHIQQTLRRNRESTYRFVQAAGTLARMLGGRLQTPSGVSPLTAHFVEVELRRSDLQCVQQEQFGYDFLKAITLWLDSGVGKLVEGFSRRRDMPASSKVGHRLPIPEDEAGTEAIDDILVPYLLQLARDKPVVNTEANRFETEDSQTIFPTEKAAVLAFAAAVRIPFADLSSAVVLAESGEHINAQDRQTALKFWAGKVAKGVLLNAAEGVNFVLVDRAFGGLGRIIKDAGATEETATESISEGEEDAVQSVEIVDSEGVTVPAPSVESGTCAATLEHATSSTSELRATPLAVQETEVLEEGSAPDDIAALMEDLEEEDEITDDPAADDRRTARNSDAIDEEDSDIDTTDSEDISSDPEDDSSEPDEEDGVPNLGLPRYFAHSAFERRKLREKVEPHVPCSTHNRVYKGHCNCQTVKDVNYFGLDDEYIVSGSDDGNFFLWDALGNKNKLGTQQGELVGVWEGDGEVVNVVQGHPFETMMAVSGIDHTIKIFSSDARAREKARLGSGVNAHDASEFSSIAWPMRAGHRRGRRSQSQRNADEDTPGTTSEPAAPQAQDDHDEEDDSYVAPNGLSSRKRTRDAYSITNQNDVDRQGGNQDAYITLPQAQLLQMLFGNLGNVGVLPSFD